MARTDRWGSHERGAVAAHRLIGCDVFRVHVSSGGSVTLSWNVSNADYVIISPGPGAIRDSSVTVNPTATTTYKLYATNQYDRTTATVTVTVP